MSSDKRHIKVKSLKVPEKLSKPKDHQDASHRGAAHQDVLHRGEAVEPEPGLTYRDIYNKQRTGKPLNHQPREDDYYEVDEDMADAEGVPPPKGYYPEHQDARHQDEPYQEIVTRDVKHDGYNGKRGKPSGKKLEDAGRYKIVSAGKPQVYDDPPPIKHKLIRPPTGDLKDFEKYVTMIESPEHFDQVVQNNGRCIAFYSMADCIACSEMKNMYGRLARRYGEKINFMYIDITLVKAQLPEVPVFDAIIKGQEVHSFTGSSVEDLKAMTTNLLKTNLERV